MTRDEFLEDPNYHLYGLGEDVPDEWFAEAWETVPEFRENTSGMIARDISKGLGLKAEQIVGLARILPLHRMVELYQYLRAGEQWLEPEYRPAFEQLFGEQMAAFPEPLSDEERERLYAQHVDPPPGYGDDFVPY